MADCVRSTILSTPKHLRHYYSEEKEVNDLVVE